MELSKKEELTNFPQEKIDAKIAVYRQARHWDRNADANTAVYAISPRFAYQDRAKANVSEDSGLVNTLLMFPLIAGLCILFVSIISGIKLGDLPLATFLTGLLITFGTCSMFVWDVVAKHKVSKIYGKNRHVLMHPKISAAWKDWNSAIVRVKALGNADEAYEALLITDEKIALHLGEFLNRDYSKTENTAFIEWFYETCAKGSVLADQEIERTRAHEMLEARHNFVKPPIRELEAASETSNILTETVKQALNEPSSLRVD